MRLEEIFLTEAGGEPMQRRETIDAVGGGLRSDRYCTGRGHYSPFDVCEVTFIEAEAIEAIEREVGIDLTDGQHRRNLVVRGGDVHELLNCRFTLGDAVFEGTRPRPPCRYIEELTDKPGLADALSEGRGGICARVVTPGEISVGNEITDIEPMDDFDGLVANIRNRIGR
jgi:MOSC domain-containing protein YiiM